MLNLRELERRWLKYKIKSYIPHVTIVLSLSVITTLAILFLTNKEVPAIKNNEIALMKQQPLISAEETNKVQTTPTKPEVKIEVLKNREPEASKKVILSPSLDFMKRMKNSANPEYINEPASEHTNDNIKPYAKSTPVVKKELKPKAVAIVLEDEKSQQKVNIKRQNTENDIYDIIKRFKKNNNPALSLFVAKKYYELENYRQAYNYALITNKINKNIESSWIIFAKSLVKLGKKQKAIKMLKEYTKQSNSNRAAILLDEIESGKFQ
ncbi:MAG: CDC27 family protein [Campylobacterota bacterium]|nr:CDC27 family protein [Campylobacterota bacterium]